MRPQEAAGHRRDPGPTISRGVAAPVEAVWSVLADGWSSANGVVGAARIRDVDPGWPAMGTRVHHFVGVRPALIQDFTRVEGWTPPHDRVLTARGWPAGEAHVHLRVRPGGSDSCVVTITEDAVSGPGRLIPAPVRHLLIAPRNRETPHCLALLGRGTPPRSDTPALIPDAGSGLVSLAGRGSRRYAPARCGAIPGVRSHAGLPARRSTRRPRALPRRGARRHSPDRGRQSASRDGQGQGSDGRRAPGGSPRFRR